MTVTCQTRYGDVFLKTSSKIDCNLYRGYCFDTSNSACCNCQCEWRKTFYGVGLYAS